MIVLDYKFRELILKSDAFRESRLVTIFLKVETKNSKNSKFCAEIKINLIKKFGEFFIIKSTFIKKSVKWHQWPKWLSAFLT